MALNAAVILESAPCVTECQHSSPEILALTRAVLQEWRRTQANWSYQADYAQFGVTFLGEGASKLAFALCSKHVLKINKTESDGFGNQSANEINFWENATPECRDKLAPIYAYNAQKTVIIAGQCEPYAWNRADEYDALRNLGISDLHDGNVGVFDGRLVILDYGIGGNDGDSYYFPRGSYVASEDCQCSECLAAHCYNCGARITSDNPRNLDGCRQCIMPPRNPSPVLSVKRPVPLWTCGDANCILEGCVKNRRKNLSDMRRYREFKGVS